MGIIKKKCTIEKQVSPKDGPQQGRILSPGTGRGPSTVELGARAREWRKEVSRENGADMRVTPAGAWCLRKQLAHLWVPLQV